MPTFPFVPRRSLLLASLAAGVLFSASAAQAGLFRRAALAAQQDPLPAPIVIPAPRHDAPVVVVPGQTPPPVEGASYASLSELAGTCSSGEKVCVTYRHVGRPVCCDEPTSTRVLCVCNPRTGCQVLVPVCLPVCCDNSPRVHGRRALLGSGVVNYDWCCGVRVTVRFERCGDVRVTYHGA